MRTLHVFYAYPTCLLCVPHMYSMRTPHVFYAHPTCICATYHAHSTEFATCHHAHSISSCKYKYGVATISRLLQIIGLFCQRALLKRQYSAKETNNFNEPTSRSHPIVPVPRQILHSTCRILSRQFHMVSLQCKILQVIPCKFYPSNKVFLQRKFCMYHIEK